MKRWALVAALSLPLPFAILPLVAIAFSPPATPEPNQQPAAMEVTVPASDPQADSDLEPLGFRLPADNDAGCDGDLLAGS